MKSVADRVKVEPSADALDVQVDQLHRLSEIICPIKPDDVEQDCATDMNGGVCSKRRNRKSFNETCHDLQSEP